MTFPKWSIWKQFGYPIGIVEVQAPFPPGANPPPPPPGGHAPEILTTTSGSLPSTPKVDEWPKKILP